MEIGDNEVAAISSFETLADAKASAPQKTVAWIAEHTEMFFQGFSKPMAGVVRVQSKPARLSLTIYEELLQGSF